MIPIYSRFNPPPSVDTKFEGESMTQQHFQDEVDINNIIKRYSSTGFLVDPLTSPSGQPMFGDFSDVIDFQTALGIAKIKETNKNIEAIGEQLEALKKDVITRQITAEADIVTGKQIGRAHV